jgi:hypothetical protein
MDITGMTGKSVVKGTKVKFLPEVQERFKSQRGQDLKNKVVALRKAFGQTTMMPTAGKASSSSLAEQVRSLLSQIPDIKKEKLEDPQLQADLLLDIAKIEKPYDENIKPVAVKWFNILQSKKGKGRWTDIYREPENGDVPPLYDFEIERMMMPYEKRGWLGCFCWDEIPKLTEYLDNDRMAFIVNTLSTKDDPNVEGHWMACWIDPINRKEVCLYDPIAEDPESYIVGALHDLIGKKRELKYNLKFKYNMVPQQMYGTSSCGIHCCRFLMKMFDGYSFKDATGWDEKNNTPDEEYLEDPEGYVKDEEKDASAFYQKNKQYLHQSRVAGKFGYIRNT